MKEKILLAKIKNSYTKGNEIKTIELIAKYLSNHYSLEKLLDLPISKKIFIEQIKLFSDQILNNYNESEIAIFSKYNLTEVVQKLLDFEWGIINRAILFNIVPELITYNNLNGVTCNNLHDLYDAHKSHDVLRRFEDDVNDVMAFDLYSKKDGLVNSDIKFIMLNKFYKSENFITYYEGLKNEVDKELFIGIILNNCDSESIRKAYEIFLINQSPLLLDHIKKYDTGIYIYYILTSGIKLSDEENNSLTNLLEKCKNTQYKLFYVAYSYNSNPGKLAELMVTPVAGLTLFFDTLERMCTNKIEFARIKNLYRVELEHEKIVLGKKIESIEINPGFNYLKYKDSRDAIKNIQHTVKLNKGKKGE